jgi:hypothetical protein
MATRKPRRTLDHWEADMLKRRKAQQQPESADPSPPKPEPEPPTDPEQVRQIERRESRVRAHPCPAAPI